MNIFVAKLSSSTTSEDLRTLFEDYGEVTSASVIMDRATGYSKKFGSRSEALAIRIMSAWSLARISSA